MTKRLSHVAPLQCGIVLAVLYGLLALVFVPFFLLASMFGMHAAQNANQGGMFAGGFIIMAVLLPVLYAVFGFIGGIIAAAIYNLVAGWTGGLEFTVTDVVPTLPGQVTRSTSELR